MKIKLGVSDTVAVHHQKNPHRFERDGKAGVVVSPGHGAGFSTWGKTEMCTDPQIVEWVLAMEANAGNPTEITRLEKLISEYVESKYEAYWQQDELVVEWVPKGVRFIIYEYDGYESIWREDEIRWVVA